MTAVFKSFGENTASAIPKVIFRKPDSSLNLTCFHSSVSILSSILFFTLPWVDCYCINTYVEELYDKLNFYRHFDWHLLIIYWWTDALMMSPLEHFVFLSNKTNRFYFTLIVTEDVKIWQEHQWYSAAHHVLLFFLITTWGHLNNNNNNNNGLLAYSLEGWLFHNYYKLITN